MERSEASQGDALAAWAASLLVPIAAELGEARQVIVAQAGELGDLRERLGRQGAELERATSAVVALGDELARSEASRRRDARRMALVLAVVATLALGAVAASAWHP